MPEKRKPLAPDLSQIPGLKEAQDGMALMGAAGQMLVEHMGRSGAGFADFVNSRTRQNHELRRDLMKCRDLGEVQRVQTLYLKTAMKQFSDETNKAVEDGAQVLDRIIRRAQG